MTLLNVDPGQIAGQAGTFGDHATLIAAERTSADSHVSTIIQIHQNLLTNQKATLDNLNAFLTKITGYQTQQVANVALYKKMLDDAKKAEKDANTALSKANDATGVAQKNFDDAYFPIINPASKEHDALNKANAAYDKASTAADDAADKVRGIQIVSEQALHQLSGINDLVTQTTNEITKTNTQVGEVMASASTLGTYSDTAAPGVGVFFRSLRLSEKLTQFATDVTNHDADAGRILNTGLPDQNWFNTKEAKNLMDFFHSTDPAAIAMQNAGKARTDTAEGFQLIKNDQATVAADKSDAARLAAWKGVDRKVKTQTDNYVSPTLKKMQDENAAAQANAKKWQSIDRVVNDIGKPLMVAGAIAAGTLLVIGSGGTALAALPEVAPVLPTLGGAAVETTAATAATTAATSTVAVTTEAAGGLTVSTSTAGGLTAEVGGTGGHDRNSRRHRWSNSFYINSWRSKQ